MPRIVLSPAHHSLVHPLLGVDVGVFLDHLDMFMGFKGVDVIFGESNPIRLRISNLETRAQCFVGTVLETLDQSVFVAELAALVLGILLDPEPRQSDDFFV